jgi:hypothetical protein
MNCRDVDVDDDDRKVTKRNKSKLMIPIAMREIHLLLLLLGLRCFGGVITITNGRL